MVKPDTLPIFVNKEGNLVKDGGKGPNIPVQSIFIEGSGSGGGLSSGLKLLGESNVTSPVNSIEFSGLEEMERLYIHLDLESEPKHTLLNFRAPLFDYLLRFNGDSNLNYRIGKQTRRGLWFARGVKTDNYKDLMRAYGRIEIINSSDQFKLAFGSVVTISESFFTTWRNINCLWLNDTAPITDISVKGNISNTENDPGPNMFSTKSRVKIYGSDF